MGSVMDDQRVWSFEESLWRASEGRYHERVDPECIMALSHAPYLFQGDAAVQADSVIQMLFFMYAWLPLAANALILFLLTRLDVEKANARLKADAGKDAPKE